MVDEAKRRRELLKENERKPIRDYLQVDGWKCDYWDYVIAPDENGYGCTAQSVSDLRNAGSAVRVQILEGTSKEIALALLGKITEWLESDYQNLMDRTYAVREQPPAE